MLPRFYTQAGLTPAGIATALSHEGVLAALGKPAWPHMRKPQRLRHGMLLLGKVLWSFMIERFERVIRQPDKNRRHERRIAMRQKADLEAGQAINYYHIRTVFLK